MWPLFQKIVDSVFPPSHDELLVRACTFATVRTLYQPTHRDGVLILLPFSHPTVRALIHMAKFHHHRHAYTLLASVVRDHLQASVRTDCVLAPIPLSRARWRERGYNQVTEIAKRATTSLTTPTFTQSLLTRVRHTTPQTALARQDRLTNLKNAFSCRTLPTPPPAIILLDDVCTTGSTLEAAAVACRQHYPDVPIIKLAVAG